MVAVKTESRYVMLVGPTGRRKIVTSEEVTKLTVKKTLDDANRSIAERNGGK